MRQTACISIYNKSYFVIKINSVVCVVLFVCFFFFKSFLLIMDMGSLG